MVSRDPLGGNMRAPMSQNRYAYAMDNPTTYMDPSGLNNGTWVYEARVRVRRSAPIPHV